MKQILLFGAGKSATVLIDYLLQYAAEGNWELQVIDTDLETAKSKINNSPYGYAYSYDIHRRRIFVLQRWTFSKEMNLLYGSFIIWCMAHFCRA